MIGQIIADIIQAYLVVLLVRIVLTWFPIRPYSRAGRLVHYLALVTDPVLAPIRRVLPPLRVGAAAIDLSPIALFVILEILLSVLRSY